MTEQRKIVRYHDGTKFTVSSIEDAPSSSMIGPEGRTIELRAARYPSGATGLIPEADIASVEVREVEVWDRTRLRLS